jgi:hypothetical protein
VPSNVEKLNLMPENRKAATAIQTEKASQM